MTGVGPVDHEIEFGGARHTVRFGGHLPSAGAAASAAAEVVTDRTVEALPPTVDLRAHCTRVEAQLDLGSCTANAIVGALEYHRKKRNMDPSDLSRLFVYYNARKVRGDTETDSGCSVAECVAAVIAYGAARADLWPYEEKRVSDRWKEEPPASVYAEAKLNEAVQYARVAPGAGVLGTIAAGFPVVFGLKAPPIAYQMAGATGVMPELTDAHWAQPIAGSHAMLLVGYDLLRRTYLVRNSWGPGFGDGGYCTIPFSVMDRGGFPEEFWVVGRLEQEGGVTLRQPQQTTEADRLRAGLRGELESGAASMRQGIRDRLTRR